MSFLDPRQCSARVVSALLVAALLAPDLARAETPAPAVIPAASPPDPAATAEPAPDVKETHTYGDLERFQAAIDTDKIGKDYARYFEGLVATQCPSVIAQKKKGILVYFKNKDTGAIFPLVVHCDDQWSGEFASASEILKPMDPSAPPACIGSEQDLKVFQQAVKLAADGGQAALAAASSCATGKNDVELDSRCASSFVDSFRGSAAGFERAVTGQPSTDPTSPGVMKQGCLETLTKVFIKNFISSGKFVVDAAKGAWSGTKWLAKEAGKGAVAGGEWIKSKVASEIWGQDNATSDAALAASSQPDSILAKIKSVNPADAWQGFVAWATNVIAGFKTIFTDELGCQVWSGVPMESTCLSPLSLKCVSCGQLANLVCGMIGFFGSEVIMSMMTGFALGATARVASLVKDTMKLKMTGSVAKLADLQEMLNAVKAKDPVVTTAANARGAVDFAEKYASSMMNTVTDQLANLNLPQAMDNLLAGYPGMKKARSIHYQYLGKGRETADAWIARLKGDSSFLDKAATASKFSSLEESYKDFAERVARQVRLSKSGRLSESQIAQLEEDFQKQYIAKVQSAFGSSVQVKTLADGSVELIDKAKVAEDGAYDAKEAFSYKPGISPATLATLSAKDNAAKIAKQLEDTDGFMALKARVAAKDTLPDNFPEGLREGFSYNALKEIPSNFTERFSTSEGMRQYGRMEIQKKLDSTLGVNRDSQFLVISSEVF